MKKFSCAFIVFCLISLVFSCNNEPEDEFPFITDCDQLTIINASLYENEESDPFFLELATITEDCLSINYSASGCDGSTWIPALYDSSGVDESKPEQRYLRFKLENKELCTAQFIETVTFDIQNLRIDGSNEIILNLETWPVQLVYTY